MLSVRDWLESDLDKIYQIEQASFSDPWSRQMLEDAFNSFNFKGFVIEDGFNVVGYVGGSYVLDEGEIFLVAVDSAYRNRGYAKELLNALLSRYASFGVKKVFLEVRKSNAPAIACYTFCGFEKIGERARYYKDGEDAIIMEKRI